MAGNKRRSRLIAAIRRCTRTRPWTVLWRKCRKLAFRWFKATWFCHGVNLHTALVILHNCLQDCSLACCWVSLFSRHLCVDNRLSLAQLVWLSLACQLCSHSFAFGWPSLKLTVQEVRVECFIMPTLHPSLSPSSCAAVGLGQMERYLTQQSN